MAEEFALHQILRQCGAVERHERFVFAAGEFHDRAGDQLLAGAGAAADQHRRVARRHLPDQFVDVLHAAAVADQLARIAGEQIAQFAVLFEQVLPLLVLLEADGDGVGDDVADDFEQREIPFEIGTGDVFAVDAQSADHLLHVEDRHAEKGDRVIRLPASGPVQKPGIAGDVGDQMRPAGLGDVAGDPLPQPVTPQLFLLFAEPVGSFDGERVAVEQRDRAAEHPHAAVKHRQNLVEQCIDVPFVYDGGADLLEHQNFLPESAGLWFHQIFLTLTADGSDQAGAADAFDRLRRFRPVAECRQPEPPFPAGAESHTGSADHLTGIQ